MTNILHVLFVLFFHLMYIFFAVNISVSAVVHIAITFPPEASSVAGR